VRRRRRSGITLGRRTQGLAALAVATTLAAAAIEVGRVWRRGSAELPGAADDLLEAGRTATHETLEVFREGYRHSPSRENTAFNLLAAFALTFGAARGSATLIRAGRGGGVFRNVVVSDRHIHHYVPGFLLVSAAGGISIVARSPRLDRWLAVPFGAGAALVVDEAALLLELEDVYWSEEGVLSLQLSFATMALLAALALGVRLVRRGEPLVLEVTAPDAPAPAPARGPGD
jgi:hypothetical protein